LPRQEGIPSELKMSFLTYNFQILMSWLITSIYFPSKKELKKRVLQLGLDKGSILEVDCGFGFITSALDKAGSTVTALALSEKQYEFVRFRLSKNRASKAKVLNGILSKEMSRSLKFDAVILNNQMCISKDPGKLLTFYSGLLKKDGKIISTSLLLGNDEVSKAFGIGIKERSSDSLKVQTSFEIEKLFSDAGLKVCELRVTWRPPANIFVVAKRI
jgi:SAM-dependent methyltransferase